jgi:4a-hydroxytetrahydrobiopterin dehydratase
MEHLEPGDLPLSEQRCAACEGGIPVLPKTEVEKLQRELGGGWRVVYGHHLSRIYTFTDFKEALAFTNRVGDLAEEEGHHPDIHLGWGKVEISLWTHAVDGLTKNDFVLAAKIAKLKRPAAL